MDSNREDLKHAPQCGIRENEMEWQRLQGERMSERKPHLLQEMKNLTQKMRPHFQDNPVGLKLWDDHAKEILVGFEHHLPNALASPTILPTTVRYEHLMKRRKARPVTTLSRLSVGLDKRLIAAGTVVALGGLAAGFVFRPTMEKQPEAWQYLLDIIKLSSS